MDVDFKSEKENNLRFLRRGDRGLADAWQRAASFGNEPHDRLGDVGKGRISSAAPISAAALGMPQTTLDDSSWAIVRHFRPRSLSSPAAPSRPMPVNKAATPGLGQFRATLAKNTSTDGR